MKILIVSATENEIIALKNKFDVKKSTMCIIKYTGMSDFSVDFLVTGIGGVFTSYALLRKLLSKKYDLVINVGIAGSFNKNLNIGEVVSVESEQFADLGIEDRSDFYTIFEKGFHSKDEFPFTDGKLENINKINVNIPKVSGITVNTTHGSKNSVELFRDKFNADIETMEGAAVFYICLQEKIKFLQIRAISNYVEERNVANWDIPLALDNLNKTVIEIINKLK